MFNNDSLEDYRMLSLSTGHLSKLDAAVLTCISQYEGHPLKACVLAFEHGFIIRRLDMESSNLEFEQTGLSQDVLAILRNAEDAGYDTVEFDSATPSLVSLPVFDW